MAASSRIVFAATALAVLAWLFLLFGFVYAQFVPETLPNPVIMFSAKGLTRLLVELASLGIGCLGLLFALVAFAFVTAARNRALAFAATANGSVCILCVALLM